MRLGYRLGKTLEELSTMTMAEVELWMGFERLEGPLGPDRDDLQSVQTSATVANMFRGKHAPAISPVDFLPDWSGTRKERELERSVKAWMEYGKRLEAMKHG